MKLRLIITVFSIILSISRNSYAALLRAPARAVSYPANSLIIRTLSRTFTHNIRALADNPLFHEAALNYCNAARELIKVCSRDAALINASENQQAPFIHNGSLEHLLQDSKNVQKTIKDLIETYNSKIQQSEDKAQLLLPFKADPARPCKNK